LEINLAVSTADFSDNLSHNFLSWRYCRGNEFMKMALLATAIGTAFEGALAGGVAIGGIGPRGPGSLLSIAILLIHTPGFAVAKMLGMGEPQSLILIAIGYIGIWSGFAYRMIRARRGRSI
jgi:hypothetical protein